MSTLVWSIVTSVQGRVPLASEVLIFFAYCSHHMLKLFIISTCCPVLSCCKIFNSSASDNLKTFHIVSKSSWLANYIYHFTFAFEKSIVSLTNSLTSCVGVCAQMHAHWCTSEGGCMCSCAPVFFSFKKFLPFFLILSY